MTTQRGGEAAAESSAMRCASSAPKNGVRTWRLSVGSSAGQLGDAVFAGEAAQDGQDAVEDDLQRGEGLRCLLLGRWHLAGDQREEQGDVALAQP